MLKMSSSDSNSGVAGGAEVCKGSIPSSVWKTIQQIKEITGNHSEEEIYAMLKECSMDPNETTQKLIFQDTFHEVKRKRDRRKENVNNKSGELNWKAGTQGQGNKGGFGNYSSCYASHDAGGGRKLISGKVNGISQILEKSISPTSIPSSQTENNNTSLSIASPNEPSGVAYAPTTGAVAGKLEGQPEHLIDAKKSPKVEEVTSDMHGQQMQNPSNSTATNASFPSSGVNFSASDPVPFPSQGAQPDGMGAIQHEVGNRHAPDEHLPSNSNDNEVTSATSEVGSSDVQGKMPNKSQGPGEDLPIESSQPVSTLDGCSVGRLSSNYNNRLLVTGPQKAGTVKEWKPKATSANPDLVYVTAVSSEVPTVSVEPNAEVQPIPVALGAEEAGFDLQKKFEESHILDVQHVIIPNHLHVPEAEKLGFCFGSFDAIHGLNTTSNSGTKNDKNPSLSETSDAIEETAKEQLPSDGSALAIADMADYPDPPPSSSSEGQENLLSKAKGDELSSSIVESNESKQENVHGDHQYSIVQTSPNHSGIMPPILGSQLGPLENSESQACDIPQLPNVVGANPLVLTTAAAASLVTQTAGLHQSSIAVPQPPLAVYRQPSGVHLTHYLPNYFPYGHYFSPFFVPPPVMHQFLSNGAFPQQPLAGSVYPPPAAAAKYSLSQYKQGANVPNSTHVGLPGSYGPFGSSTANYNPPSAATAGNPTSNEDLSSSQLKESSVYDSAQQNEGSGVWITAPGRDVSSLQASPFYSLPQSHMAFTPTQPGHGPIAGIYHPVPPVTNPALLHPLLQQSQAMAGPVDMVGPTATVYQQPQYSQLNWPNNF
ncbi:GBF-interacting protein 1-like isoform X2 [Ipomoea triloba]|uniref:GBF-interacting protein 1-like isoform X2 n=1 Tax=Ipomoea triloba TaxID=35885 RepID=UPI00125E8575|nr:GBF-interacting protein 1-like isoform X2 [Ipomoea triloba]